MSILEILIGQGQTLIARIEESITIDISYSPYSYESTLS